jgi:large subunit ribosomal protein L22e
MVAVRQKVGSRGFLKTKPLTKGKKVIKIDCSVPAADGIFDEEMLNNFEQHFAQNTKLHGRKGKLGDKVKIDMTENVKLHGKKGKLADKVKVNFDNDTLTISTTMKYKKKYFKYLTKKFLKKKSLRDWLRVLSTGKGAYQLRYFNIQDNEAEEE